MSRTSLSALVAAGLLFVTGCENSSAPGTASNGGTGSLGQAGTGGASGSAGAGAGGGGSGGGGGVGGTVGGTGGATAGGTAGQGGSLAGGSAGQAGSAGQGGAGPEPYNPCPTDGSACRLMPLGDSITDGVGSSHFAGYRVELFRQALADSRALTFVGGQQNGPDMVDGQDFPNDHEGHSGWTIADGGGRQGLYEDVIGWLEADPPHIITLQIGTNDISIDLDLDNAGARLGLLLDRIIENAPDALIVVAQIVPTTDDDLNDRVEAFNAAIPALVSERQAAGAHVELVDMYGAFTANQDYKSAYMDDYLHPSDAGYEVMADTWYEAIGELLPPAP